MSDGGLSGARLGRLRDSLAGYVERGDVPGLVGAVSRRGETHVVALGALATGGPPLRRDALFRIASMTKPVTALAALMLVEGRQLRLDEPVDRLLPELANRRVLTRLDAPLDDTVPAERPITVRDLLTFTMGLGIVIAPPGTYPIQRAMDELELGQGPPRPHTPPAPDEWLRRLGTLPLMSQPGERWIYHTGADVLGALIARAADQPFDAYLRERVFEPLGMRDTAFSVAADKLDRLATGYGTNIETGDIEVFDEAVGGQWSRPPAFPSGGAGLVSTVDDYLAFAQLLLNNGRHGAARLLARPTIEAMTTDQLTPAQKAASLFSGGFFERRGWGFGVSVVTKRDDACATPGSYGWDGGLGTTWLNDPREQLTTILLTQTAFTSPDPPTVHRDFRTLAYGAIDD